MKKNLLCLAAWLLMLSMLLAACSPIDKNKDGTAADPSASEDGQDAPDTTDISTLGYLPTKDETIEEEIVDGSYRSGNSQFVTEETVNKYPRLTNLPALYIKLDNNKKLSDVQHGVYTGGTYTLVDDHVITSYYELPLQIKGRGNWSWSFAQKPYSIKLDKKADFLGMGAAKKWVLVTVHSDKSMMHNFITQKLAARMGLPYTCENEYVDVIVNDKYVGTYVLTEKIQIHESRIDLKDKQGALFEIEMVYRHDDHSKCVLLYEDRRDSSHTIHLELKEYKDWDLDNLTRYEATVLKEKLKVMQDYFDMVSAAMRGNDFATLQEMIDVDSFVNWYLLNELTRNYDSMFVTSCYCFINEDNKLVMGPVWDYDTCYGIQYPEYDTQHIQDAPWYGWLFRNCPEFVELVGKRWEELRKPDGIIHNFYTAIDDIAVYIAESEKMEHKLYPSSELYNKPFDDCVKYFKTWLLERIVWMDNEFLPADHGELDAATTK